MPIPKLRETGHSLTISIGYGPEILRITYKCLVYSYDAVSQNVDIITPCYEAKDKPYRFC